jgi:hypothetical protein
VTDPGFVVGMPPKAKVHARQVTVQVLDPKSGKELMPALTVQEALSLGIALIGRAQHVMQGYGDD